jgi:hypothetical protein
MEVKDGSSCTAPVAFRPDHLARSARATGVGFDAPGLTALRIVDDELVAARSRAPNPQAFLDGPPPATNPADSGFPFLSHGCTARKGVQFARTRIVLGECRKVRFNVFLF